jgi:hypothetical protein
MVPSKGLMAAIAGALSLLCISAADAQPGDSQAYKPLASSQVGDRGKVLKWFTQYDNIRRNAQMTPSERSQADGLLSKGMSILTPGQDKVAARALLTRLVDKYTRARAAMKQLPMIPETQKLHRGYYQYFTTAHDLFASYLTVQDNLFAQDENGQPVLAGLVERKQKLETLNSFIQDLDRQTRSQYGVAAYRNPAG